MEDIKIDIYRTWDDYDPICLGTMTPPMDYGLDSRSKVPDFWNTVLDELWAEWEAEVPEPDSDSVFINWLVEKGWELVDSNIYIEVG